MTTPASIPASKILLGFTGGIRSSVASVLLKTQGLEVLGAFVDFEGTPWDTHCRRDRREQVQARADALEVPLVSIPAGPLFEAWVADPALHDVLNRRMPQTCLNCHSRVLFPVLQKLAEERGIPTIATGHRASLHRGELRRTSLPDDQASWLAFLPRAVLDRISLPLGVFSTQQIEKLAREIDEGSISGRDTRREICELRAQDWLPWANERTPEEMRARGPVTWHGSVSLAEHQGIFQYPIGSSVPVERSVLQGETAARTEPLIATEHDEVSHTLKLEFLPDTARQEVIVEGLNWIDPSSPQAVPAIELEVKAVGLHAEAASPPTPGLLFLHLEHQGRLLLRRPMPRLLRGAALVFESGGRILGTGWVA